MNALIDFIISVCTALASLMPAFGKIKDNRYKGLNKIRPLGWLTILSLIASIGLTFYKTYLNEKDNNKKEVYNKIEQSRRDKYTKNNYDSSLVEIKKQFDTSNISQGFLIKN